MKSKLTKLFTLLTILTLFVGQAWGAYYTPTADEVIILKDVYNSSATTTGYSDHSAVAWAGTASTNSKKAGDPNNGGAATSSNVACYSVKGNGGGKNITISITGCSKIIIYHESHSSRYVELRSGSKSGTLIGNGSASTYYTEVALTGSTSYDIFLHGTTGSNDQDFNVYAIKLIKAPSGDPVDVTGITLAPSSATIKVGKTVTLVPTITPNDATDKAVTWAVTSGSTYASVSDAGVVTGLAAGSAVITATAHDGSGVTQTATITVEDCPTSGTLFSMTVTDPDGTVYTDVTDAAPQLIGAAYTGGKAYATSTSSSKRSPKITGEEFDFNVGSGGSVAVKVELDCPLAEGDIITFTSTHDKNFYIRKVVGTDLHTTSALSLEIPAGSALIGEDVFYVMRTNSACSFSEINIIRPVYRTITLEYADGATPDGSLDVIDGTAASQPADPTWAHHRFDGWYNGASPYDWSSTVSGDLTLTAHWTQLYTITYAAGDGTATGDAPTQEDKAEGETFSVAANTFTVAGKDFVTWTDGANDYAPSATYTVGTDNVILTAQWTTAADKYTVHYMDEDGTTPLGADELVNVGEHPAGITATKPLFTFASWQLSGSDIALSSVSAAKDEEVTLTARWTKAFAANIDFETFIDAQTTSGNWQAELAAKNYAISSTTSVTLDAPDGKPADKGLKIKNSGAYISFNVNAGKLVLLKAGVLSGAEASVDGGANYTALTGASGSTGASVVTPLYNATEAEYRIRTTTGSYNIIQSITITNPYTVTFEAHGDADPTPLQGTPSVTLPTPTNGTASFTGWFDAETGGNKIGDAGETYTPTADITLHAQWETVSTDARLASITFSAVGTLSPAFNPEIVNYTYTMPYPTASVPTITGATAVNANAQASVIDVQAANWGDVAQIHGVAESGDTKNYYITMKLAPKDGICLVWADVPANNTLTYNSANSKIYAESDVTLVNSNVKGMDGSAPSGKKFQANGYLKLELTAGTFKAGDIVALNVTYGTANVMHVYKAQSATAADVIGEATGNTDAGLNMVAITEDATTLWLVRGGDYADWNPHVDYVAVYRPMNPILNKITVNGVEGTPDALNAITIEVPASTTQSELEAIVYDWISNSDAWTANPANAPVATNAWAFGVANTVTLTDKDGDASVYTVTVNKAAVSTDATLASLTVNGQAVTLVPGQFTYDVELPHGISVAPTVVATANHPAAVATVDPCTLSGATITVVPESGAGDQKVYTLNFTINPWAEVVIWDGSTMTEVATSPIADLEWTVNGFGDIANYNATCGTKAYTKCLKSGGAASASRNVELVVPTGYIAKFYIVVGTHEDGTERGMFIGTAATKTLDASSILEINNSVRTEPSAGTSEIAGAGTWYINPEASVDFYEIRVLLRPGYARTAMLGNGVLGTICVPNNVAFEDIHGATFYELSGKNAEGKIAFDQITTGQLEAGVPYVFQANGDKLVLFYGNEHEDNPQDLHNGMYGTFTDLVLTELDDVYYFAQKALWSCTDLTSLSIPANRAYVKLSELPDASPAPAPGRIRMTLNVNGAPQVTTGMEEITNDQSQMANKVIIDGRLFILRGEKLYDATGRLVK